MTCEHRPVHLETAECQWAGKLNAPKERLAHSRLAQLAPLPALLPPVSLAYRIWLVLLLYQALFFFLSLPFPNLQR